MWVNKMKYDFDLQLDDRNSLTLIAKQVENESLVLEFGPANGRLTHYLKEHKNCKVYAVEIDADAAKDAAKYTEDIIIGDIEQFSWLEKWENIEFDYILFADVLEHLRNPMEVLKQTKCLLKEDGKVILSVPNVTHNSIMINLHREIFSYTPVGLLDDTHIHLFSYYSLKEMCSYAGYTPVVEDAIYVNVGETEIKNNFGDVSKIVQKALRQKKYGNVYQFFFTLQKTAWINNFEMKTDYRIRTMAPGYYFQVFFDRGEGWLEENSVSISTKGVGKVSYTIDITNAEEINAIRIDPINTNALIKNLRVVANCAQANGEIELKESWTNGLFCSHLNEYLFETEDPQIVYSDLYCYAKEMEKLEVELEYIDVCVMDETMRQYREYVNQIQMLNEELDR